MSQTAEFRSLEQKIYLAYQRDGLLDLIIGAGILCLGFNEAMDTTFWGFLALMLIIAYVPLKRSITFPRIGYVRFKIVRHGFNMMFVGAMVLAVLVLLLVGTLFLLRSDNLLASNPVLWIRRSPLLLYALLGSIGFGLAGLITGIRRLYFYSLLSLIIPFVAHLLKWAIYVPFLFFGGVILVTGGVLLVSFLRTYPIAEENHDIQ